MIVLEAVTFVFGASVAVWIFQFGHSKVSEHPLGYDTRTRDNGLIR